MLYVKNNIILLKIMNEVNLEGNINFQNKKVLIITAPY